MLNVYRSDHLAATRTTRARTVVATGILLLCAALPASAAIILDTAVTGQFTPYATTTGTAGNSLPGKPSTLYYGQLKATTSGLVDFYYIGNEAGYTNTFVYGDGGNLVAGTGSLSTAGRPDNFKPSYPLLGTISVGSDAFLDFGFCTSGGSTAGAFGRCAHNENADSLVAQFNLGSGGGYRSIAYVPLTDFTAAGTLGFGAGAGTSSLWGLFWDDSGAQNDDNHDDLIVVAQWRALTGNIVSVPEPATLLLFALSVGGGLLVLKRRTTLRLPD